MATHIYTRRRIVELALAGAAGLAIGCSDDDSADTGGDTDTGVTDTGVDTDAQCPPTGSDIEGPFYVSDAPVRSDLDTWGDPGLKITLSGVVTDGACAPLANAVVEIWQADDEGDYDNASADMRYRGQQATDADGRYQFTTIMPGHYLNGASYRPAHIHVKVWVGGEERLTTQLYFAGDPYNADDPWFDPAREMAVEQHGDGSADCTYDFAV